LSVAIEADNGNAIALVGETTLNWRGSIKHGKRGTREKQKKGGGALSYGR